jgi:hypothetical protein
MPIHKRSTRLHIPEDGILHSHRREKSQILSLNEDLDSLTFLKRVLYEKIPRI